MNQQEAIANAYKRLMVASVIHPVCGGLTLPPDRYRNWEGRINITVGSRKGRKWGAHQVVWAYHNGATSVPKGMMVCHHCDQPDCFDPEHVYLGTQSDNMRDMVRRKRRKPARTERLTDEQVIAIYCDPRTLREIMQDTGIARHTILGIKHRRYYRAVTAHLANEDG